MNKYEYCINMNVPLGIRKGTIILYENNGMLTGLLELFENSEPFSGRVYANGACNIAGKIVTLTKTIRYQAIGQMCSDWIKLNVYGKKEKFLLEGKRVWHEKVL